MDNNCRLTGYLPYDRYVGLLRGVDVILDLTSQDHTLLMGAFEAVSLGTPLIVSDWPILRDYFSLGTVHVPNTVEGFVRECAGPSVSGPRCSGRSYSCGSSFRLSGSKSLRSFGICCKNVK